MSPRTAGPARQRGAALILIASLLILGVAWGTVGALNRSSAAASSNDRGVVSGNALHAAKQALLSYVAQYAANADSNPNFPGRLPCPESLNSIGGANEGEASSACSNVAAVVGRLPWKTLGVEPLRDGDGERLWYVLSPNFHPVTVPPAIPLNFGTPALLPFEGANVVALIIAPGKAVNTLSDPGTPTAGCAKLRQTENRYVAPLDPAKFFECGNATGAYANLGNSQWTNDRVIAITQAEWVDAIAAPVTDRLQRQVAPAMYDYYNATSLASWGQRFFPNASTFTAAPPTTNNLCGNVDMRSGMPPTATVASVLCDTNWTGGGVSGLGGLLSFGGCSTNATRLRCDFTVILGGLASPRINATAPRIGYSFRRVDPATITIQVNGGAQTPASTGNYTGSVSAADGSGTSSIQVFFPPLSILDTVSIRIPHPTDALLPNPPDPRTAWYIYNGWDRYTYYGVAQAATSDPAGTCNPGGTITGCLTVLGTPAPTNDKRLVLVLMGPRALAGQSWPSTVTTDYMEYQNGSVGVIYEVRRMGTDFNDRVAACPYKYYDLDGVTVLATACN